MGARMSLRAVAMALLAALLALAPVSAAEAPPEVAFDRPAAEGSFGEDVTFSTTFSAEERPLRVELLTRGPDDVSERVTLAAVEGAGGRFRATVSLAGHIAPNTSWSYRFRAVTPDGEVLGPVAQHRLVDERYAWDLLEGERVRVWSYEGGEGFARRALATAEEAVDAAAELLGVVEMEPVDFFIYTDEREFRQAMGPATRENIGGQAHLNTRTLFGLIKPEQIGSDWVDEVITHELAHLVFHDLVDNPYQYPPRWLNEGVAVYLAEGYSDGRRSQVEGAAGGGTLIPLEGLGGQFPTRAGRQSLAYAVSIDAVDHFVETYGEPALVELIAAFGEGRGLDGAFLDATGDDFAAFDAGWLDSLGADQPEPFGPLAGDPGPVPDAWTERTSALLR